MEPSRHIEIKYPRNETPWVEYLNVDGSPAYLITSRPLRDLYYIYRIDSNGTPVKLGRSANPGELAEKYVKLKREANDDG